MPTPFNHLVQANEVLGHSSLPKGVRKTLQAARGAFLFGNTAPDLGMVSGLPRAASHFFDMPMIERRPAHLRLLESHPELEGILYLRADHAAFMAGYLAHLWLDQAWISAFFEPHFGPTVPRGSFRQRLFDHNLLRAYLDREDRNHLPPNTAADLDEVEPDRWLPFAPDEDLRRWRDVLSTQLGPGGASRTVSVFAHRLGVESDDFAARLSSPEAMEQAVFRHVSQGELHDFWERSAGQLVQLVAAYLQGKMDEASEVNGPFQRVPIGALSESEGVR